MMTKGRLTSAYFTMVFGNSDKFNQLKTHRMKYAHKLPYKYKPTTYLTAHSSDLLQW